MTAFRAGLGESDPVKVRNAMAQAPPAAHPDTVSLRPVDIPRVPVPGLEESASGHVVAEWLEPKGGADKDAPVMIYYHGGVDIALPGLYRRIDLTRSNHLFIQAATAS